MKKLVKYFLLLTLLFIIILKFIESIQRGYGIDEYDHLHYAFLLSKGSIPFRDHFNVYTPIFNMFLVPFFFLLGENFLVFTLSRIVVLIFFLLTLLFTYKIAHLYIDENTSLLAVIIAASLPIGYERTIDIRSDNLMIPLMLIGIYYFLKALELISKPIQTPEEWVTRDGEPHCRGPLWGIQWGCRVAGPKEKTVLKQVLEKDTSRRLFLSGIFFALSTLVLLKIIATIAGFILGVIILSLFDKKIFKKILIHGHLFIIGFLIPIIIYILASLTQNILPQTLASLLIYAKAINDNFVFGGDLHPFYWFNPISGVYGTYKDIPWYYNFLVFGLAILGIFTTFIKSIRTKTFLKRWLLFLPAVASFLSLYLVSRPFQQYLLPFLSFIPFWSAFAVTDIQSILSPKAKLQYILPISLSILIIISSWKAWELKKYWTDTEDRKFINYILTNTSPEDTFYGAPTYVFRFDGYFDYYGKMNEYPPIVTSTMPAFIPMLEQRKTKYIISSLDTVKTPTWPYDQPIYRQFRSWILENYTESGYPSILVRKTPFAK